MPLAFAKDPDGNMVPLQVDADGNLLTSGGGASVPHDLLDGSVNQDTVAGTPVAGDVIVGIDQGGGTIKWQKLARGASDQILVVQVDGSLAWEDKPAGAAPHNLLDGTQNQDTQADGPTPGKLIVGVDVGGGTYKWYTLPPGSVGDILSVFSAGVLAWVTPTYMPLIPGIIMLWTRTDPPDHWLLCQGQAVSRTTYATLFAYIGLTFGAGDGSTTFNVPDLAGRAPIGVGSGSGLTTRAMADKVGEETHQLSVAELAAHHHAIDVRNPTAGAGNGAIALANAATNSTRDSNDTGSGTAHNNMQPSLALNFIIYTGNTA